MPFHRFVQPAYFGAPACPAGPAVVAFNGVNYNLFNVTSGGIGAGGSALMSDAKPSGVNTGTYAVAFGEDATSTNFNRGFKALVENTDTLDDWFHRDIASPVRTANVAAGAPVASIVLPAGTYVGSSIGYSLDTLFSILTSDSEEILDGDNKVSVASITGATIGDGFSAGAVTLNLSFPIPAGVTYYVVYGTRSNLATLPADALIAVGVRASEEVAADVRRMIAHLKNEPATAWDANPTFNTWGLGAGGLNSLYRRSSTGQGYSANVDVSATTINTPGSGAEVVADGRAITSAMYPAYAGFTASRRITDPGQALFRAEDGVPVGGLGHIGFAAMMSGPDTTEAVFPSAAGFSSYRRMGAGTYSVVSESAAATMSAHAAAELVTVELGTALAGGPAELLSAVRCGYDLIRVRLPATIGGSPTLGDRDISLRIISRGGTSLVCAGVDGFLPTQLKPLAGPITVTVLGWYSASFVNANGATSVKYSLRPAHYDNIPGAKDGSSVFLAQRANTAAQLAYMTEPAVKIFGSYTQKALEWGDSNTNGYPVTYGALGHLGSVISTSKYSSGYTRSARRGSAYDKVPRIYVNYNGIANGQLYFNWDANVGFTPGAQNADRTAQDGSGGAKFPQQVLLTVNTNNNVSLNFRLPFRDVTVGDEITLHVLLETGVAWTAGFLVVEAHTPVVGGVQYKSFVTGTVLPGPPQAVIVYVPTGNGPWFKFYELKFRCMWSGVKDGTTHRTVLWALRASSETTLGADHLAYMGLMNTDPADVVYNGVVSGTSIDFNAGWY